MDAERWTIRDVNPWTINGIKQTVIKKSRYGHGMVTVTGENQKIYCILIRDLKKMTSIKIKCELFFPNVMWCYVTYPKIIWFICLLFFLITVNPHSESHGVLGSNPGEDRF